MDSPGGSSRRSNKRPDNPTEVEIVVIGLGPGGEAAAGTLAEAGVNVVGIEASLVGGECPYWGCIPSKMMIRAGNALAEAGRVQGLAGGAFNSPPLLMLSGIGPANHLSETGVQPVVDLPGVGSNLQDRYEVSVVTRHEDNFTLAADCTFGQTDDDPCEDRWREGDRLTPYTSNGVVAGLKHRSAGSDRPDLFVFGSPARFEGYQPGFESLAVEQRNYFTWAILKGYSRNRTGTVRLGSTDPTEPPDINFRYFNDGEVDEGAQADLDAIREGVQVARTINGQADRADLLDGDLGQETFPRAEQQDPATLDTFIKKEAWGHHTSCTNPMGPAGDPTAVVDANFRVHGVDRLRIVDASVFP